MRQLISWYAGLIVAAAPLTAQSPTGVSTVDSAAVARLAWGRGVRALNAKDLATARTEIRRAARAWPTQPTYVWGKAYTAALAGDTSEAIESLDRYAAYGLGRSLRGDSARASGIEPSPRSVLTGRFASSGRAACRASVRRETADGGLFFPDAATRDTRSTPFDVIAGHFGVAMAARSRSASIPLFALVLASVFPDTIDFVTAALQVCGPNGLYSHSLPSIAVQTIVLGGAAAIWRRSLGAGAVIAAMVLLHLGADYITGLKVLWPGGPVVGLNLYSHPLADFILEAAVTFTGWRMLRASPMRDRWSSAPVVLAALLAAQAALDVASYMVGPVKPNGCPVSLPAPTFLRA